MFEDLSRLIANFILSSISDLHFDKCKYILDRLEELENIIHDRFNIKSTTHNSMTLSPIPSMTNINNPNSEEQSVNSKGSVESHKRVPSISLKGIPSSIYTYTNMPRTPTGKSDTSVHELEEKSAFKKVLRLIAKAKYTMAQLGHLLHYDRLGKFFLLI